MFQQSSPISGKLILPGKNSLSSETSLSHSDSQTRSFPFTTPCPCFTRRAGDSIPQRKRKLAAAGPLVARFRTVTIPPAPTLPFPDRLPFNLNLTPSTASGQESARPALGDPLLTPGPPCQLPPAGPRAAWRTQAWPPLRAGPTALPASGRRRR